MDKVLCQCVSCSAALATYSNLWTQIGKGYYSPVLDDEGDSHFVGQGAKREGEEGTLVAECILQDLACSKCEANIGLKCVSSPINHVLHNDQILLRQAAVRMVSPRGRNKKAVELKVQRVLKLKDGPKPASTPPSAGSAHPGPGPNDGNPFNGPFSHSSPAPGIFERMQAELDVQRGDIDRIDTAAFSVVSSFNTAMTRIDMELEKLNDTMKSFRRDLDGYKSDLSPLKSGLEDFKASSDQGSVKRLEDQIDLANETVANVRKLAQDAQTREDELQNELQTTKKDLRLLQQETMALRQEVAAAKKTAKDGSAASASSAREISLLKAEMRQMRESFKQEQERSKRPDPNSSAYSAEEVQILSNNIAKLASRTNQFEALQMQFDLFKPRMQRLEGRVSGMEEAHTPKDLSRGSTDFVPGSMPVESLNPRKRHAPELEAEAESPMETPSKRQSIVGDTVHFASSPIPKPSAQKQARKVTFTPSSVSAPGSTKQGSAERRTVKRGRKPTRRNEEDSIYSLPDD